MLSPEGRRVLRAALPYLEKHVVEAVHDAVFAVHENITPGKTTLDEVAFYKGKADGMAELWATLTAWAEEPEQFGVPAEKPVR